MDYCFDWVMEETSDVMKIDLIFLVVNLFGKVKALVWPCPFMTKEVLNLTS